jgi:hypothetical protein
MGSTDEKSSGKKVSSNCAFTVHRYNICKLYAFCITVWALSLPIIINKIASQKKHFREQEQLDKPAVSVMFVV